MLPRKRAGSKPPSPERLGPRTPVTVTSSFDEQWESARKAIEVTKSAGLDGMTMVASGHSGAGLTRAGSLGAKVDVKGKGRRRRGVGPGVTWVFSCPNSHDSPAHGILQRCVPEILLPRREFLDMVRSPFPPVL